MDGLADDVVLCLEACNHVPEDGLFGLVAGIELHGNGDLVAVEQESQPNNRVLAVFLAGTLAAEIVFPVDFKVEVGAVKIGAGGIYTKNRLYLGGEYLDELLVIDAQEGKGGKGGREEGRKEGMEGGRERGRKKKAISIFRNKK